MEITIDSSRLISEHSFAVRDNPYRTIFETSTLTGVLLGLLAGPAYGGAHSLQRSWSRSGASNQAVHKATKTEEVAPAMPIAETISGIKENWQFNMTELAEIMGVQRPTIYNWLKGKTTPDIKMQRQLHRLAAAASIWKETTSGSNWDFLLDYSGPKADEITIREILSNPDVGVAEIEGLIHMRLNQYREAYARSREILGEPTPVRGEPIRESTRKLNKRWTEHAHKLHRLRNASQG